MNRLLKLAGALLLCTAINANAESLYLGNRAPLKEKPYIQLPIGAIHPEGWLDDQLHRMIKGSTGHLDQEYELVCGKRNCWLGGDGDAWERGPYWIDGLLPLAYILDDKEMKAKVKPWIEWALASQQPNGQFGPTVDREPETGMQRNNALDWWPRMVMLKIMQQYYSATGDKRVIKFLTNYFKYQLETLPSTPLGKWTFWAERRGGDNLMVVYWLYNITGDEFLLELGDLLHKQTFNWTDVFLNQDHLSRQYSLHCVNLGQGFKEPVIYYQRSGKSMQTDAVKKAVKTIRNTIGLPTGLWGGDEMLRFGDPTVGSECCTAVEMMFSLESILEITGDVQWADYLERVTYNALPTQIDDDFESRQYYQQFNQVTLVPAWRNFSTPHSNTDVLFGERTGYPCCTCNMHQGWPKFVQNLFYATNDNGLAALVYAPANVKAQVADGKEVMIEEKTNYPFDEKIEFTFNYAKKSIKSATFPFHLRIPAWCKNPVVKINGEAISLNAKAGEIAQLQREWKSGDKLTLELPMNITTSFWYGGRVVERGPLLYALKMNEKWEKKSFEQDKVVHYGPYYWEVTSDSPWNYALMKEAINNPENNFEVVRLDKGNTYPWNVDNAPIELKTQGRRVDGWEIYRGSAGPVGYYIQQGKDYGEKEPITLIPYGCTTLRIALFPVR